MGKEHTPTPWETWDVFGYRGKDEYPEPHEGDIRIISSETNVCVAVVFGTWGDMPELAGNPELIVTAVNSHVALVEALELVRSIIKDGAMVGFVPTEGDWADRLFSSQADTLAALKKAKGEA